MKAEDREIAQFVQQLHGEVRDRATGGNTLFADFHENTFTELISEWLSEYGLTENPEVCYFERKDGRSTLKVNGFSVSDDERSLDIYSTIYSDSVEGNPIPPELVRTSAQRAVRFFEAAKNRLHEKLEAAHSAEYAMASRICDVYKNLNRVRIFVLTDGYCSLKQIAGEVLGNQKIQYEIFDAERLYRLMQAGLPREEIEVDLANYGFGGIPCIHTPRMSDDYEAYLAMIPGEVLYRLYEEYGSRLLELNVRSFLQARGKVNRGIRDTLRNKPDRFFAFNNGIVATVDDIAIAHDEENGNNIITSLRGLQIVNGGQTTASIHKARRDDKADLSSVFVPAKISVIAGEKMDQMVPLISQYANTQNAVQMADFSANDPFHVEIARLSEHVWCPGEQTRWFYERSRGQYEVAKSRAGNTPVQRRRFNEKTPPSRKFNKVDLAKFTGAWAQRPDKVSLGGQKCFAWFMQDLKDRHAKSWQPDEGYYKALISKAILFKEAARVVRSEAFPAYRANIIAYLVSYLSYRTGRQLDLDAIWQHQSVSPELTELLRDWSYQIRDEIVRTSEGRNVTEWCKKEGCWSAIRSLSLEFPDRLPPEVTATPQSPTDGRRNGSSDEVISHDDLENIYQCQQLSALEWIRISEWGARSNKLKDWEVGIAHTLSGYAAGGWSRQPSTKQAKHGVRIRKLAEDEGALDHSEVENSEAVAG